jgi:PhzF family phenazine biosynthesis protein
MIQAIMRPYCEVDVFTSTPYEGNLVAVVMDATNLSTAEMQRFARWTDLSETTFLLPATDPRAHYRVRIFTPTQELPFAGHPTLGSCHAWLERQPESRSKDVVVQECAAGLIEVRRSAHGLAFAAPPLLRDGPVDRELLRRIARALQIDRDQIVDATWADNGPGWVAVLLKDAEAVLALRPGATDLDIGVVGAYPAGAAQAFEVRAFFPKGDATVEDPVTGSLNAALAPWLLRAGRARSPYVVSQGTVLGRSGRVHITQDEDEAVWVGGGTVTCVSGEVRL